MCRCLSTYPRPRGGALCEGHVRLGASGQAGAAVDWWASCMLLAGRRVLGAWRTGISMTVGCRWGGLINKHGLARNTSRGLRALMGSWRFGARSTQASIIRDRSGLKIFFASVVGCHGVRRNIGAGGAGLRHRCALPARTWMTFAAPVRTCQAFCWCSAPPARPRPVARLGLQEQRGGRKKG